MREQLTSLRRVMEAQHIDAYLIPTTDFHGSEYIHDHFKVRAYISGFTGSAGTLLVTRDAAKLWTDGRYFLQAEKELTGSGIDLMKTGEPDVPSVFSYLGSVLQPGQTLAFDGRVMAYQQGQIFSAIYSIVHTEDPAEQIWPDRPEVFPSKIYPLPDTVTGESCASKLGRLFGFLKKRGADYHLITKLEDIAWLFNLRGSDINYTPVFFAYALIIGDKINLYTMSEVSTTLPSNVQLRPYDAIYTDLAALPAGSMLLDQEIVSYSLVKALPDTVEIENSDNPVALMRALKNQVEIKSTKNAHLKDGLAMVNFIYWLKSHIHREKITEVSAADYLEKCRRSQEGCFDLSFDTICGYEENGAIVHYSAKADTCKTLHPRGFLLVDSGGQYEDGTTDITRTIALGPLSEEMKYHYTMVLRSHIALATASFPARTTGAQLDAIARKPLHEQGLNYNHGTGHGVGHILSVHEGPQTISPKGTRYPLYPGMITSNEPGLYLEGQYGIRLENEILCRENFSGAYGFQTITLCPFERDAILPQLLNVKERKWLNAYHQKVYKTLSPFVDEEICSWLSQATAAI